MFKVSRILVIAQILGVCAVALTACGQKGPLVHPQDPLAAERATLLQTLTPQVANPFQNQVQSERDKTPAAQTPPAKAP